MSLLVSQPQTAAHDPRIDVGVTVAGLDPEALVRDHGSPLFVYDLDVIAAASRASFGPRCPAAVELAFAVKANPSPGHPRAGSRAWASVRTSRRRASWPP